MMNVKTISLITGGFDPIHCGHLAYFESAKTYGDLLIVGVNSDEWLRRKKGKEFLPLSERLEIVKHIVFVDGVLSFDDTDGSAKDAIHQVRKLWPDAKIHFCNGGDRTESNIPEMDIKDSNIEFMFGVGGNEKKNSSSQILAEWYTPKTQRPWGYYNVLHTHSDNRTKVKELTVEPGKSLSMQRHFKRSEFWFVSEGEASLYTLNHKSRVVLQQKILTHQSFHIDKEYWHQLVNETDRPLKIVEIQYGETCTEEDIERK